MVSILTGHEEFERRIGKAEGTFCTHCDRDVEENPIHRIYGPRSNVLLDLGMLILEEVTIA